MKIAVVTEGTVKESIGEGHELRLYEIFRRLARDNEVHIIQPAPSRRNWEKDGIVFHDLPPLPGRLGRYLFRKHFFMSRYLHASNAVRTLRKIRPDVVDIFGFVLPLFGRMPPSVGSFAYYERNQDSKGISSSTVFRLRAILTRIKLRRADFLVMMSRNTEERMKKEGLLGAREYSYIPNGVDPDLFYPRDMAESRKAMGLPGESYIVILCGQLAEFKRPLDFLNAFLLLPDKYLGIIVGRGQMKEKLNEFILQNSLDKRVRLVGYVQRDELPLFYSACDVSAYMGEREIQPLVPQESMACGTPPIVSNAPGNNEIVQDGVTGSLFKPRDVADFVRRVRLICEESGMRDAMSRAGVEFMKNRSWDRTAELTFTAYQRAIEVHESR